MGEKKEWSCWEITNCGNQERCLAGRNGNGKSCWEVARGLDDYRSALNVCKDCIVYLASHDSGRMSSSEIERIIQQKVDCVLSRACPQLAG